MLPSFGLRILFIIIFFVLHLGLGSVMNFNPHLTTLMSFVVLDSYSKQGPRWSKDESCID